MNSKDETLLNIKAWIFFQSVYVYIEFRRVGSKKKSERGELDLSKNLAKQKKKSLVMVMHNFAKLPPPSNAYMRSKKMD